MESTETLFQRVTTVTNLILTTTLALAALWAGWEYNKSNDKQQGAMLDMQRKLVAAQTMLNSNSLLLSTQKKCVDAALSLYGMARSGTKDEMMIGIMRQFVSLDAECRRVGQPLPQELINYFASLNRSSDPKVASAAMRMAASIAANRAAPRPRNLTNEELLRVGARAEGLISPSGTSGTPQLTSPAQAAAQAPATSTDIPVPKDILGSITPLRMTMLSQHNAARKKRGIEPVIWSDALAAAAQSHADQLAKRGVLEHSRLDQRQQQGESLWMGTRGAYTFDEMMNHWLQEARYLKPGKIPDISTTGKFADVGHFTQIIWPNTREIGCAIASGARDDYLVCRYLPAGNISGQTF